MTLMTHMINNDYYGWGALPVLFTMVIDVTATSQCTSCRRSSGNKIGHVIHLPGMEEPSPFRNPLACLASRGLIEFPAYISTPYLNGGLTALSARVEWFLSCLYSYSRGILLKLFVYIYSIHMESFLNCLHIYISCIGQATTNQS